MELQIFVERILETANLTDNLEDADADHLLRWGVAQIPAVLDGVADDETAGQRVSALMAFMRQINRLIGARPSMSLEELVAELEKLAGRRQLVFGVVRPLAADEYQAIARRLWTLSVSEALQLLLNFAAEPAPPLSLPEIGDPDACP